MTKPLCFVISPIGQPHSLMRRRADGVLKEIIEPAVGERYRVLRADELGEPGLFTEKVVQAIREAELCVADLTDANPNVMYELALRHIVRKPVIQMIEEEQPLPADVAGVDTVTFKSDLAGRSEAVKKLRGFVEQVGSRDFGNPIVRAIQITELEKVGTAEAHMLASVLATTQAMASRLNAMEERTRPRTTDVRWPATPTIAAMMAQIGNEYAPSAGNCAECGKPLRGLYDRLHIRPSDSQPICFDCSFKGVTAPRSA